MLGALTAIGALLGGVGALWGAAKGTKGTTGKSPEINKAFDWGYYDDPDKGAAAYRFTRANSFYQDPNATPTDQSWTDADGNAHQGQRPGSRPAGCDPTSDGLGCKFSSKRYLQYGFNRISPGAQVPQGIPDSDLVKNATGETIGYFSVVNGVDDASDWNEDHVRNEIKVKPYVMSKHWGEGQKWLAQRDFFNRQDQTFTSRDAANQLSIRQRDQAGWLGLGRQEQQFNQQTSQQLAENQWQWQQAHAQQEGDAYRARMQAMYPGASTWDLLGSSGASAGTGPGSLPGIPGAPPPSAGTMRSGPDPTIAAAKLQSSNAAMQTAVNAKLQQSQMQLQDAISRRNAEVQFLNTAISGATGAADIMSRAAAAKQALATTAEIPENAISQRMLQRAQIRQASAQTNLADQRSLQIIPEEAHVKASQARLNEANTAAAKYGSSLTKLRNNLGLATSQGDVYATLGALLGIDPAQIRKMLGGLARKGSIR